MGDNLAPPRLPGLRSQRERPSGVLSYNKTTAPKAVYLQCADQCAEVRGLRPWKVPDRGKFLHTGPGRAALPVANPPPRDQETNPYLPSLLLFWPSLVSFQLTPGSPSFQAEKMSPLKCPQLIPGPPRCQRHGTYSLWSALGVQALATMSVCSQDSGLRSTFGSLSIHSTQELCSKQLALNPPNSQAAPAKVTLKTPLKMKNSKAILFISTHQLLQTTQVKTPAFMNRSSSKPAQIWI